MITRGFPSRVGGSKYPFIERILACVPSSSWPTLRRTASPIRRAAGGRVPVWTINYGGIPLGVGAGLTAPGVQYQASRIVAAACEGVSMYCALRRVIFAPRPTPGPQRS